MLGRHLLLALLLAAASPALAMTGTVTQTNLTSDGSIPAPNIDPNLKNPWGISYSPTGPFWVSDNATGLSTLYDGTGAPQSLVVTIPAATAGTTGTPTGQAFNPTTAFVITQNGMSGPAVFIFATEDGTISAWSPSVNPTAAVIAVDHSAQQASYKGVALFADPGTGKTFLLATDFHNGRVEVFNDTFKMLGSFHDSTLPQTWSPYNVAVLNGNIFVTYAQVDPARHDSVSGPGKGAVEQVTLSGMVLQRFMHGTLNAPWGLATAPASAGPAAGDLLVGNFGNGRISVFTPLLQPQGVVMAGRKPLSIDGLWGLIPGNGGSAGDPDAIYFTAGPNDEQNGLFGSLTVGP